MPVHGRIEFGRLRLQVRRRWFAGRLVVLQGLLLAQLNERADIIADDALYDGANINVSGGELVIKTHVGGKGAVMLHAAQKGGMSGGVDGGAQPRGERLLHARGQLRVKVGLGAAVRVAQLQVLQRVFEARARVGGGANELRLAARRLGERAREARDGGLERRRLVVGVVGEVVRGVGEMRGVVVKGGARGDPGAQQRRLVAAEQVPVERRRGRQRRLVGGGEAAHDAAHGEGGQVLVGGEGRDGERGVQRGGGERERDAGERARGGQVQRPPGRDGAAVGEPVLQLVVVDVDGQRRRAGGGGGGGGGDAAHGGGWAG
ncbi:hypothetical protein FGB62_108g11 [Gracilaria domingensis]|nr:hypothetical protein FGB62_108g11 [Gracilaria domingensis]